MPRKTADGPPSSNMQVAALATVLTVVLLGRSFLPSTFPVGIQQVPDSATQYLEEPLLQQMISQSWSPSRPRTEPRAPLRS